MCFRRPSLFLLSECPQRCQNCAIMRFFSNTSHETTTPYVSHASKRLRRSILHCYRSHHLQGCVSETYTTTAQRWREPNAPTTHDVAIDHQQFTWKKRTPMHFWSPLFRFSTITFQVTLARGGGTLHNRPKAMMGVNIIARKRQGVVSPKTAHVSHCDHVRSGDVLHTHPSREKSRTRVLSKATSSVSAMRSYQRYPCDARRCANREILFSGGERNF